jgi:hypothetical protein
LGGGGTRQGLGVLGIWGFGVLRLGGFRNLGP